MSDPRWDRIQAVYALAAAAAGPERAAVLDRECGDDLELRRKVESLLYSRTFDAPPSSAEPVVAAPGPAERAAQAIPLEQPGSMLGPYRLVRLLGEGGFGVVFLAEQERPLRRTVALKVVKLGMDTRQVIARFEQERHALGLMDHPNIAKVLDAGATATGRPFFVMEHVKGDPITRFADERCLDLAARLDLFTQVCAAVQHAHTKGVIHRDLKPGNVLVSLTDGRPLAKVIDFGIAKATGPALSEQTMLTDERQLIGTPEYMSPEQADGSPDIDTRTDAYALGVLLYELLTGLTPFDSSRLRSASFTDMQKIIREEEPPIPSLRRSGEPGTLAQAAAARGEHDPRRLMTRLHGELDWIVMKAIEKTRARRYQSAAELAEDVRRHLDGEPVRAAPPSAAYRTRKFMRRHRGPVAAAAGLGLTLAVGAVVATIFARQARAANVELIKVNQRLVEQKVIMTDALEKVAGDLEGAALADPEGMMGESGLSDQADADLRKLAAVAVEGVRNSRKFNEQLIGERETVRAALGEVGEELAAVEGLDLPEPTAVEGDETEDGEPGLRGLAKFTLDAVRKTKELHERSVLKQTLLEGAVEQIREELADFAVPDLTPPDSSEGGEGMTEAGEAPSDPPLESMIQFTLEAVRKSKELNEKYVRQHDAIVEICGRIGETLGDVGGEGGDGGPPGLTPPGEGEGIDAQSEDGVDPALSALGEFSVQAAGTARDLWRRAVAQRSAMAETMRTISGELEDVSGLDLAPPMAAFERELSSGGEGEMEQDLEGGGPECRALSEYLLSAVRKSRDLHRRIAADRDLLRETFDSIAGELENAPWLDLAAPMDGQGEDLLGGEDEIGASPTLRSFTQFSLDSVRRAKILSRRFQGRTAALRAAIEQINTAMGEADDLELAAPTDPMADIGEGLWNEEDADAPDPGIQSLAEFAVQVIEKAKLLRRPVE